VNRPEEAVFGADFSAEDIPPREVWDAGSRPLADERTFDHDGFAVGGIETTIPTPGATPLQWQIPHRHDATRRDQRRRSARLRRRAAPDTSSRPPLVAAFERRVPSGNTRSRWKQVPGLEMARAIEFQNRTYHF